MFFNTRTTAIDKDTMRLSITINNSVTHDAYNNGNEYYGSTWFQDGADNYLNANYDNVLGGVSDQNAGYGASSHWINFNYIISK